MLRAAVLLASVSLVMALPAAASDAAAARSLTIRVYVTARHANRSRTFLQRRSALGREYTKGDTIRGTAVLRNAVPTVRQAERCPCRAPSSFVITAVALQKVRVDFVASFPGGTVHAHGVGEIGPEPDGADCRGHWPLRGSNRCRRGGSSAPARASLATRWGRHVARTGRLAGWARDEFVVRAARPGRVTPSPTHSAGRRMAALRAVATEREPVTPRSATSCAARPSRSIAWPRRPACLERVAGLGAGVLDEVHPSWAVFEIVAGCSR